jgi:myo-inositol 2-dehydrogenase / D-chiro-inositol 1-dehydrogenase
MANVRVGVIGAGVMGRAHCETLKTKIAGATLAAVSDPDSARANAAAQGGEIEVFADALRLIASPKVDAIVIVSPDDRHEEQAAACLAAGKPALCEKPLAPDSAACRRLVERERASGRRLLQVGYMRRFDPAYADLKAAYDSGAVGKARVIRCIHRNASAPSFFVGGMAISNSMVHEFDIIRWLLGAEIARVRVDQPSRDGKKLDDPVLATLEISTGELVLIEVYVNAVYGYDIRTEIVGESGVLTMGAPAITQRLSNVEPGIRFPTDFTLRFRDAYTLEIQAWIDAIATGHAVGASVDDGLRATLAAEAATRALASGQWETVEA